jgi:hypothetical protein
MMQDADPTGCATATPSPDDAWATEKFDYILANPPYGVDWKAYAAPIKDEHEKLGFPGASAPACRGLRRVVPVPAAHAQPHEAR